MLAAEGGDAAHSSALLTAPTTTSSWILHLIPLQRQRLQLRKEVPENGRDGLRWTVQQRGEVQPQRADGDEERHLVRRTQRTPLDAGRQALVGKGQLEVGQLKLERF